MKNENGIYMYIDERGEMVLFDIELSSFNLLANGFKIPTNEYFSAKEKFISESIQIANRRIELYSDIEKIGEEAFVKKYLIVEG